MAEIRFAQRGDTALILKFIKKLAEYEAMSNDVVATEKLLEQWIFEKELARVLFIMEDGEEVGFALFFYNFSTFLGKGGIHLEDLFVLPEYRGKGYGKALLCRVASIALQQGCGRMEWSCLDWNKGSIAFYRSLGAEPLEGWTQYRLSGDTLLAAANMDLGGL